MTTLQKLIMISAFMATILVMTGCQKASSPTAVSPNSEARTPVAEQIDFEEKLKKMEQYVTYEESAFSDDELTKTFTEI
jgi:hypothetical protein